MIHPMPDMSASTGYPPYVHTAMRVLEAAKANNDSFVIAACRRAIRASTIGRRDPEAMAIVRAFID